MFPGEAAGGTAAPSGGATTTGSAVGSGTGAPNTVDYATTSDDQILDVQDEGTGTGATATPGQGEAGDDYVSLEGEAEGDEAGKTETEGGTEQEGDGAKPKGDEGDKEEEEEEIEELREEESEAAETPDPADDPQVLKDVFKKHPELRESYYREQAYRQEFPTVAEAREYKQLAPTLDNLKTAVTNSRELEGFDDAYFSANPADHQTFFQTLAKQDPAQFAKVAQSIPDALYTIDPTLYRSVIAEPAVVSSLGNLMQLALQRGLGEHGEGQNLANAVDVIAMTLFGKRLAELRDGAPAARTPRERELEQQLNQRTQTEQQQKVEQFQAFHTKANEAAVNKLVSSIKVSLLGKKNGLLKDTAFVRRPEAVNRMIGEIYNKVDAAIRADRELTRELRQIFQDPQGRFDEAHLQRVIASIDSRSATALKKIAPGVVTTWTKKLLADNTQRQATEHRAAARRDVTGAAGAGPQRNAGAPRVQPQHIDYSRTSDEDILAGRARLRRP